MRNRPWTHMDPAQVPRDLKEPAMDAGHPVEPGLISLDPPPPVPYDGPIHDADG